MGWVTTFLAGCGPRKGWNRGEDEELQRESLKEGRSPWKEIL